MLIGRECGKYVASTLLPNGGKICEIKGLEGTSGGIDRDNGFREGIKDNPKCEIIAANNADWLREKAITVAEEMLQANDEIDLFFALNDPMAEGAYIAAKNAGREKDILFVGVDGLPTPDGGIKSVMDGRLSLSMVYPTGGKEAVESAYKLLVKGETLEKNVTLGTRPHAPRHRSHHPRQPRRKSSRASAHGRSKSTQGVEKPRNSTRRNCVRLMRGGASWQQRSRRQVAGRALRVSKRASAPLDALP